MSDPAAHHSSLNSEAREIRRRLGGGTLSEARKIAEAMRLFARLGWAMSGVWPVTGTERALDAAAGGAADDEIDAILCEVWNGEHSQWMSWNLALLRRMGAGHVPTQQLFWRRAELIEAAIKHHRAGAYEASIPILLAQIDGLSYDLFGQSFYPRKTGKPAVDDTTLAGLDGNLEVARRAFKENAYETDTSGSLSRHGVQHGRDLAYNTEANSTKTIALLLSLLEHAQEAGKQVGLESREAHEETVSGSLEVDADGRFVDDRELPGLRAFRSDFGYAYHSWIFGGKFEQINFVQLFSTELHKKGLDEARASFMADDAGIWFTYHTPNGRHMAWATALTKRLQTPRFDEWWWEDSQPPNSAPWVDETGWSSEMPIPINWEPVYPI